MTAVGTLLSLAVALYILLHIVLVISQRKLIFLPPPLERTTPADYGTPFQSLKIPVAGGGEIAAWWIEQPDGGDHPTILYSHGNAANLPLLSEVASIFYSYGWNALMYDYRGYGESSAATALNEESLAEDAFSAWQWVSHRRPANTIILWGHSLGAAVAARLAERTEPAGLILEGAFPDLTTAARFHYPWALIFPFMLESKFATASHLANHRYPILFVHTENDSVVPLELGRRTFELASGPKEFLLIPRIGHSDFPSVAKQHANFLKETCTRWTERSEPGNITQ